MSVSGDHLCHYVQLNFDLHLGDLLVELVVAISLLPVPVLTEQSFKKVAEAVRKPETDVLL